MQQMALTKTFTMRFAMKKILALFLSLLLALALPACGTSPVTDELGRREIVMAVINMQSALSVNEVHYDLVEDFNRNNSDYFITVVNYLAGFEPEMQPLNPELGEEATLFRIANYQEAYEDAKQQLDRDLTARNRGRKTLDIVVINSTKEYLEYARAGVLADLNDFYQRDIDQTAVFANFFEAMKVGGKLYGIGLGFYPQGLYMDKQFAGLDFSLEAMLALQKESDYPLMGSVNKLHSFWNWYDLYQHEFIDWEAWRCDFNTPNFISILEIAGNTPENAEATYFDLLNKAIREQKPFFMSRAADVLTYQAMSQLFGGNVAFASYPAANPDGLAESENILDVEVYTIYAVAANSSYQEAAWGFLSGLVSEEYQRQHVDIGTNRLNRQAMATIVGMPVARSALELVIEDGLEGGFGFPKVPLFFGEGASVEISQLEPEAVAEVRPLWEQDMRLRYQNDSNVIIGEEVGAYFDGFISQERLLENLNNRVQLYLNEIKP
jgi:ABC-type glycerol-3-phosphate transport system substrate-binding protein